MYRLLRFVFGPLAFLLYFIKTYFTYARYAGGTSLLGMTFRVVGALWVVAALITLLMLFPIPFSKNKGKRLGIIRTILSGMFVSLSTFSATHLCLFMARNDKGMLSTSLLNIVLFFVTAFVIALVFLSFKSLYSAINEIPEPAKKKDEPKSLGAPRFVIEKKRRGKDGKRYVERVTVYKGKSVVEFLPA